MRRRGSSLLLHRDSICSEAQRGCYDYNPPRFSPFGSGSSSEKEGARRTVRHFIRARWALLQVCRVCLAFVKCWSVTFIQLCATAL